MIDYFLILHNYGVLVLIILIFIFIYSRLHLIMLNFSQFNINN